LHNIPSVQLLHIFCRILELQQHLQVSWQLHT